MPRNASGTYSLPSGNPVSSGTLIDANWANNTLNDLANEVTDSLSRSAEGGMLAPLRLTDGVQATPSLAFTNEPSSGLYRAGTNDAWFVSGGNQVMQFTSSGVVGRLAAGAVGTPSLTFFGDPNTGLWSPAADTLAASTGGSERLRVDSSGNVGIGTTSPYAPLQSAKVTASTPTGGSAAGVGLIVSNNNNAFGMQFGSASPGYGWIQQQRNDGTNTQYDLSLQPLGGNVGIGTASPTFGSGSGVEVERAGIATLRLENSSASNSFEMYVDSAANGINLRGRDSSPMLFWTGNTERMRIDASGNLGIGTTSPTYRLDVVDAGGNLFRFTRSTDQIGAFISSGTCFFGGISNSPLAFVTNNTERMRITATGNIVAGASAALATTATDGFLYVPTCAGTPTGTPTAITGMAPIVVNTTNNKLYFYSGGAWRDAGP